MIADVVSFHVYYVSSYCVSHLLFFFNDTTTTEIYTLSLHDALPISDGRGNPAAAPGPRRRELPLPRAPVAPGTADDPDRKSTRLNSSHGYISYAVFCLKKKMSNSF